MINRMTMLVKSDEEINPDLASDIASPMSRSFKAAGSLRNMSPTKSTRFQASPVHSPH